MSFSLQQVMDQYGILTTSLAMEELKLEQKEVNEDNLMPVIKKMAIKTDMLDKKENLKSKKKGVIEFLINKHDKLEPSLLANHIMNKKTFITTTEDEKLYYYNGGIYKEGGKSMIKEIAQKEAGEFLNQHTLSETIMHIMTSTYTSRSEFDTARCRIHLENGIYDTQLNRLEEFDKEEIATTRLPIKYDEEADCQRIKKFMSEILSEEDVEVMQELFGYCLLKDYPYHKAFMFLGEGANGKSTLINLFKTFLGIDNTTAVALQDLEKIRFSASGLYGKLANLYPDLSSESMTQISKFKALTGGDMITAEYKFGQPFNFVNYAKMIFSCNALPEIKEDSQAVYRRWIVINFDRTFEGKDANPNLLQEITSEAELSGLFNWAVQGLIRLEQKGGFSYNKSTKQVRDYYIKLSSPIRAFTEDCLIQNPGGFIIKEELYKEYAEYCKKVHLAIKSEAYFSKKLKEIYPGLSWERRTILGERKRGWIGISFDVEVKDLDIKEEIIL